MDDLSALLQRFIFSIWRKRWIALAVAWVACIGGWFAVATIPNQYEASARVYVDTDSVLTPLLRGLALESSPTSQLELLQQTVLSRPNLEKLISKTDLELSINGPADLERMVFHLAETIRITPQTRNLFTISYRTSNAKLAYDVVQAMLTIFIESKAGNSRADMENARQFIDQQLTQYEQKLRLSEAQRAEFRLKYLDLLPQDSNGGLSHLEAARMALAQLQDKVKDAVQQRDLIKQQLDQTPATLDPGEAAPGASPTNPLLLDAERRLAELRLKYTDQHPDVIAARHLLEQIRSGAIGGPTTGGPPLPQPAGGGRLRGLPNPVHEQLTLQLFDADSQVATLRRQIADQTRERDRLEAIARGVPGLMAEYADLNRDYDVLRHNHEELLARRELMRIASAADTEGDKVKLEVVDPPQVPQNPVAPKRALLDSAVLGLGFAAGIGVAFMLLQFDSSFQTVDELRQLELPVVGSISMIAAGGAAAPQAARRRQLRRRRAAAVRAVGRAAAEDDPSGRRLSMTERPIHLVERVAARLRAGAGLAAAGTAPAPDGPLPDATLPDATLRDLAPDPAPPDPSPDFVADSPPPSLAPAPFAPAPFAPAPFAPAPFAPPAESPARGEPPAGAPYLDIAALKRGGLALAGVRSRVTEEYRIAVGRILRALRSASRGGPGMANLIMITSARPGEGKSFSALNLAVSVAQNGLADVLLVDIDAKPRSLSTLLGLREQRGLLDLVDQPELRAEDVLVRTAVEGLQ